MSSKLLLLGGVVAVALGLFGTFYLIRNRFPSQRQNLSASKILDDLEKAERANREATRKKQDIATIVESLVVTQTTSIPQANLMTSSQGTGLPGPIQPPPATPPPPTFTVQPSANVYRLGEPVVLTLTLTAPPATAATYTFDWTVCTFAPGSVTVGYVKHDGTGATATHTIADFPEDPTLLQEMFFTSLPSGNSTNIPFPLGMAVNGAALLYDSSIRGAYSQIRVDPVTFEQHVLNVPAYDTSVYKFDQPGLYAVRLRYHYTGPLFPSYDAPIGINRTMSKIFTGTLISNEAIFSIQ